jgi:hypothetical protein
VGAAGGVAGWRLITQGGVPPVMVVVMLPVADDHMALAHVGSQTRCHILICRVMSMSYMT